MLSQTLSFLSRLKENNNREWFNQNRKWYDEARSSFVAFVELLIPAIKEFDHTPGLLEAKDCLFRIHRDIRFSHDKTPYKTNFGAFIARGGRKSRFAGYYFHVEPGASMASGGIYMADTATMRRIRMDIDTYPEKFLAIVESDAFQKGFPTLEMESLKRVPRGFSSQSPVAKYLMLKHISPIHPLDDGAMASSNLIARVAGVFKTLYPLVDFINTAIEEE